MTDDRGHLVVLMNGRIAGILEQTRQGRLQLTYDDDYGLLAGATPISLSMPLSAKVYDDRVVRAYLRGLLPDSEQVLERWGSQYQVSPRNPYALLRHVGEDCPGAVQFARFDRLDLLLRGEGGVDWITDDEVARRLRVLRADPASWHLATRSGQFSLAGAQAKTALHYSIERESWGDPWGSVPTTHILKPAITGLDDHDLNEHICMEGARLLGLIPVASRVASFGEERVIVIERYDRSWQDGRTLRVHQEDLCQSLGVTPAAKYQNEGGPSPEQVIGLLRGRVQPPAVRARDIERFVGALAFNWVIGGTDAHAKNYSVLLSGEQARLALLYDVASILPYDDVYLPKLRMAMRIGGEYRLTATFGRHWKRFAAANALDPAAVLDQIARLIEELPGAIECAAAAPGVVELGSSLADRLVEAMTKRAADCLEALGH